MSTLIKKITPKVLCGNVKKADEGELFKVFGIATGTKIGETNFGEWECLTGRFKAITPDGVKFESARLFLPEIGLDIVKAALVGDGNNAVEFALSIGKKNDDEVMIGYVYTVTPLITPEPESDPLLQLEDRVNADKEPVKGKTKK